MEFKPEEQFTRVEGQQDDNPFDLKQEDLIKKALEDFTKYKKEAEALVDSYRPFFTTFAKDVSLKFRLSDRFMIDWNSGEVHFDVRWFAERGYTKEQILWAFMHEIAHFRDLTEDPDSLLKTYGETILNQARSTGSVIMDKLKKSFGDSNPEYIEQISAQKPIDPKKPTLGTMNEVEEITKR